MTYLPKYFAQKAKTIMDAINTAEAAPNPEEWLKACLIAFTSEWKRYSLIPNQDRPRYGFNLSNLDPHFWIQQDGHCALAKPGDCYRELSYAAVIKNYGSALVVLRALDAMLDMTKEDADHKLQESKEVQAFIAESSFAALVSKPIEPIN